MGLTELVIVFGIIISVAFLLLVITLIPAINQLRIFIADLQKTSAEVRSLTTKLGELGEKIDQNIENVQDFINSSKNAANHVSKSFEFISKHLLKSSAGLFALLPAIKFGWKLVKKAKGGKKNV